MRSFRRLELICLFVLGMGFIPRTSVAARNPTSAAQTSAGVSDALDATSFLSAIEDNLKKLEGLIDALNQVREGKRPNFKTPLGELAEQFDKLNKEFDKQNSAPPSREVDKPSIHHPGSAIAEITKQLQDLRTAKLEQLALRKRQNNIQRALQHRAAAARLLTDSLLVQLKNPSIPDEIRPVFENLWLDSDRLQLALAADSTDVAALQKSTEAKLTLLAERIANRQAYLEPHVRSIISAIDQADASAESQITSSIQATKADLLNRDRTSIIANQQALQRPTTRPVPARNPPTSGPPSLPSQPTSHTDCPPGYWKAGENCAKIDWNPQ